MDAGDGTDVEAMAAALRDMRDELREQSDAGEEAAEAVKLDQSKVGRLSRMDALQGQAMAQATQRRRMDTLRRVQSALQRIEDGSYGDCLRCDKPISPQRLSIDPAATLCISCAQAADDAR